MTTLPRELAAKRPANAPTDLPRVVPDHRLPLAMWLAVGTASTAGTVTFLLAVFGNSAAATHVIGFGLIAVGAATYFRMRLKALSAGQGRA